jgi:NAD(P)H dehydrogenase (quinone)
VTYQNLSFEDNKAALLAAGLPAGYAQALADSDLGIAEGHLEVRSGDLARLIGRPATTLADAVAVSLKSA